MAKKAKRLVKRVGGNLTVVFVDADTGVELSSLDGYELITSDNQNLDFANKPATQPVEEAPAPTRSDGRDRSSNADFWTKSDWAKDPSRSKGTGDILGDFAKAGGVLQERVEGVKGTLMSGIMNTFGRVMGTNVAANITPEDKKAAGAAAGNAVRGAGGAIQETAGNIASNVGGMIGGLFGGDTTATPATTALPAKSGAYGNLQNPEGVILNPQLQAILDEAALRSPYQVVVTSGERKGDTRQHGKNNAVDINLINPDTGEALPDYQNGPAFRAYEQFAQTARTVQQNMYPELDADLRWGGYFTASGNAFGYGAADLMHFDLAGKTVGWGAGGSWAAGASRVLKQAYPGLVSQGMGTGKWELTPPGVSPVPEIQVAENAKRSQTQEQLPRVAQVDPTKMGIDPKLLAAVDGLRVSRGLPPVVQAQNAAQKPTLNTPKAVSTANLGDEIAMAPIQGGTQVAPPFDAGYDPISGTMRPLAQQEEVSSQGLGMVQHPRPVSDTKLAQNGFKGTQPTQAIMDNLNQQDNNHSLDAFLRTLNEAEGSPKANQLFGFGEITDFKDHPRTPVAYAGGTAKSTAAGLFQINEATWDDYADPGMDFSEPNQWEVARRIASAEYKGDTGRDLAADLASGDKRYLEQAYNSLSNRWASLPNGSQSQTKMQDMIKSFETNAAFSPPSTKPVDNVLAPAKAAAKMSSAPTSFDSVVNKVSKNNSTPTSTSGFMGTKPASQKTGSASSRETATPTPVTGTKISKPTATTQSTGQKQSSSVSGFVSRPTTSQPTSNTSKVSSTPKSPTNSTTSTQKTSSGTTKTSSSKTSSSSNRGR